MPDVSKCHQCGLDLEPGDVFCARCGAPGGHVEWSFAADRGPAPETGAPAAGGSVVSVRPGGRFYLVARNAGTAVTRVELDLVAAPELKLAGSTQRRVAPSQSQAFELALVPDAPIRGRLLARSEEGGRLQWWERRSWIAREFRLPVHLRETEDRWVVGVSNLLFPPGVRSQYARVWNDSESERAFESETPAGYRVTCFGVALDHRSMPVAPCDTVELAVQPAGSWGDPADTEWRVGPDGVPVGLHRMPAPAGEPGADVVVAIDFGTRNTRIRVRWRRGLVPAKPPGTVDRVGDRGDSASFPTQMVVHLQERTFRWGSEASDHVAANRTTPEEVAVDNLKTYLREGQEHFTRYRKDWSNEELLRRYFERIVHRLDLYFRTADPILPLSRSGLNIRYVVCRPVLDANEGDAAGRRYERALTTALVRCGVPEEAISFVHEPVAAAVGVARRREGELLALPEGAALAVVDSGGGTTDIALARVRFEGGRVSLDLAGSYALHLAEDNPAIPALQACALPDRREVGGNVLDSALAHALLTNAPRVLDTEGREIPHSLWRGQANNLTVAWLGDFIKHCRRMKERFARASTQHLNRAAGEKGPPGEVLPFPNRDDLRGIYLVHGMYDENVVQPVLRPVVEELTGRISQAGSVPEGVRPAEVRRVFYVGGTNIDPFVRLHFGRAFPLAPPESDPSAQSDERIEERLNAVVEGAVWTDERLFAPSPLTLSLRLKNGEQVLLPEGAAVLPAAIAAPRFVAVALEAGEELQAALIASGGGLPEPLEVARAFYRNEGDVPQDVALSIRTSRELGCAAELQAGARRLEQWRFALVEAP